jgi:alanine racemase
MDMLTVDLTHVPRRQVGSKVTLWGEGLPIDTVAKAAGTIGYELMCAWRRACAWWKLTWAHG